MADAMKEMTDEEAEYWDELFTCTTPKLASGPQRGFFTERRERLAREAAEADETVKVDHQTAQWLRAKADATHKTPAEIIDELVREKIAVTAYSHHPSFSHPSLISPHKKPEPPIQVDPWEPPVKSTPVLPQSNPVSCPTPCHDLC